MNDLVANTRGGAYFSVTGVARKRSVLRRSERVVSQHGKDVPLAKGIILSPDEKTLYVTNGAVVFAFDVKPDGSLTNQREFGKLQGGDGSAVDQQGRVYVATGKSVGCLRARRQVRRQHPGPAGPGQHVLRRPRKKTLFGIVFYDGWGTPSARNRIIAIPMIAQGYSGRAKWFQAIHTRRSPWTFRWRSTPG